MTRGATVGAVMAPKPIHRFPVEALGVHGFTGDDIWDIAAITAFFAMSNRLANVAAIRPNDEFYLMGRLPKAG